MPDLMRLDAPTRRQVGAAAELLRASIGLFGERYLRLAREHIPAYDVLDDQEIRDSAGGFLGRLVAELESLRVPDAALRPLLEDLALRRAAQGVPIETMARSYQLASREMLAVMDEVAAEVGLPADLLLAIHDSTWEFANEAAAVFARVQHDLGVERVRFDAERRSSYTRGVLSGALSDEQIERDAHSFGLDHRMPYRPVAARASSTAAADAVRRVIATALHVPPDRLLFAEVGTNLGCIATSAPAQAEGSTVAVGPALPLTGLAIGFEEAVLALETAERFEMSGVVRLADLGPRPLVLSGARVAGGLAERHLAELDGDSRSGADLEETVRVHLECDQDAQVTAARLTVHPNTVRYRVNRFRELTGLDLNRTEDLVSTWFLLNRRRSRLPD
jgi:hypothetical protein